MPSRLAVPIRERGSPQQFIDRASEPFARADSESAGRGLGLAIVDVVARAMAAQPSLATARAAAHT